MARIIVAAPQAVLFQTRIRVNIGDINYGNHLANDAVLRLCHEARLRWLTAHGFNEINIGGAGLIMADSAVQYTAQSHHGDELEIRLGANDIGRSGFALHYEIERCGDGQTIARVQTGMVCFDYSAQKVAAIPERFRAILEAV